RNRIIVEADVSPRFMRAVLVAFLVLAAVLVTRPYLDRMLFAGTTPRAVEPRGNLAEAERSNIEIFDRTSPSVVQIAGREDGGPTQGAQGEGAGVKSGTGFV